MTTTDLLSDKVLLEQIKDGTLDPKMFTHEVMLRLSWILINKYDLETAIKKNCEIKENYYVNTLKNNKFNVTLSRAYTEILYYFKEKSSAKTFDKLLKECPRLQYDFKDLVKTHYGYNILKIHRKEEPKGFHPIFI